MSSSIRLNGITVNAPDALALAEFYAEITDDRVEVFVRDRGKGFDLAVVPDDRFGVTQSIVGRMERHGGKAVVRSSPGGGTEVQLELRRA